jgi:hypothetical protein
MFETYAHNTGEQDFDFIGVLFQSIHGFGTTFLPTLPNISKEILKFKKIVNRDTCMDAIRLQILFQLLTYGYLICIKGHGNGDLSIKSEFDIKSILTNIKSVPSETFASDIMTALCPESDVRGNVLYHFTELSREAFFIRNLAIKLLPLQSQTCTAETHVWSLELNKCILDQLKISGIIKTVPPDTSREYWQDYEPLAKQYSIKMVLYTKHANAINQFKLDLFDAFNTFRADPGTPDSPIAMTKINKLIDIIADTRTTDDIRNVFTRIFVNNQHISKD